MKPIRKDTITVLIATIIVFVGIDLAESIKAADKSRKHLAAKKAVGANKEEKKEQAEVSKKTHQHEEKPTHKHEPNIQVHEKQQSEQQKKTVETEKPRAQEQTQPVQAQAIPVTVHEVVKPSIPKKKMVLQEQVLKEVVVKTREPQQLADISQEEDLYDDVFIILGAGNINEISTVLATGKKEVMLKVVGRIVNDLNSPLGAEGKIKLIFSLARLFAKNKEMQDSLFKLLMLQPQLINYSVPFLYVASNPLYAGALSAFYDFKRRVTFASPSIMQALISADAHALKAAINHNNVNALRILLNVMPLTPEQATHLLLIVVTDGKNAGMVKPLVNHGADVNAIDTHGHTLLMVATKDRKSDLVKALLEAKARIDYKDSTGTDALFIALDNGYLEIEQVLRDYGAREW